MNKILIISCVILFVYFVCGTSFDMDNKSLKYDLNRNAAGRRVFSRNCSGLAEKVAVRRGKCRKHSNSTISTNGTVNALPGSGNLSTPITFPNGQPSTGQPLPTSNLTSIKG